MQVKYGIDGERLTLGFSLAGLSARDETLFKSFIRLIDHRLPHRWVCQPQNADAGIVGDEYKPASPGTTSATVARSVPMLTLTTLRPSGPGVLALPLHAEELEQALNQLARHVLARRASAHFDTSIDTQHAMRLLRWPPAQLLDSPLRIRLATLLSGKPASVDMLQLRSGASEEACVRFFSDLTRAGLLQPDMSAPRAPVAQAPTVGQAARAVHSGLLSRIRMRLGIGMPAGQPS